MSKKKSDTKKSDKNSKSELEVDKKKLEKK